MSGARVLADFRGLWHLRREIVQQDGTQAQFLGTAEWRPEANGLLYSEEGQLSMPGSPVMRAERRYVWREDLSVFFEDGRFFHRVPAEGGETEHWCDPDTYKGRYDFKDWPCFEVSWHVTGPHKAYHSRSLYERR